MKQFFDFIPVALFYATFQVANHFKERAAQIASNWFGFMVSGGSVGPAEAPTVLATVVVVLAIAAQIALLLVRRKPISTVLWVTLGAAVVFGGATVWFHDPLLIKWKFSVVYWLMAAGLLVSHYVFGKNAIQKLVGDNLTLPAPVWVKLNLSWAGFFAFLGTLNIFIAYHFSENFWYNFKFFGSLGLFMLFGLAQALVLSRYIEEEPSARE